MDGADGSDRVKTEPSYAMYVAHGASRTNPVNQAFKRLADALGWIVDVGWFWSGL